MIPQGWQEKTLGEVSIFSRGLTYSKKDEVDISDNIVLRANNIDLISNTLNFDELKYLNKNFIIPEDKKVKKNSILICISSGSKSHLGKVAFIDKDYSYAFGGFMGLITPMQCIFPRFLYYMLISQSFIDFTSNLTDGANINNLKYSDIKDFRLRICPLSEQERIVAKLDEAFEAIDKVKANAEQNLTNTKELFESYLNNIFSNINASFNKKLSDITKIVGGGTPSKSTPTYYQGNIPWATVRDMNEYDLSKTEFSITNEAVKSSATNIIPANNVIIATRVGLGKVCILMQDTAINQDLKGIIPTKPMNFKYLFWWFKSIKNKIEEAGVGATVKGVKLPFVQNLQIPYISINDQQKIVEKLDALQEQTKRLEQIYTQKIKECDELKQSILQKAFRGEL